MSSPKGTSTRFTLDGSLLTAVTWQGPVAGQASFTYDDDLRLTSEVVNGSPVSYAYDDDDLVVRAGELVFARDAASGALIRSTLRQLASTVSRNGYGEVDDRATSLGPLTLLSTHVGQRDAQGRVLARQETIAGEVHDRSYIYDAIGRLTDVEVDGLPTEHYDYDANGNRLAAERGALRYECRHDAQDRLVSQGNTLFSYTPDGALESKADIATGETTLYRYDLAGNLLGVTLPTGATIEYVLDAEGHRLGRKLNGAFTARWVYGGDAGPAAEIDADGGIVTRFVYATRSWVPAYMVRAGRTYALVTDDIGSVRLVVDADSGEVAQRIDYDTFGRITLDTHPGFQPFAFAGGLYDVSTGLVRLGARDYDADTGRWTTKDPLLFGGGGTNLYAYAANDPVNQMDPAGLSVGSFFSDLWLGAKLSVSNIRNGREDPLVDAIAGFGDALSFGLTAKLRGALGLGDFVDTCSSDYYRGTAGGEAYRELMLAVLGAGLGTELSASERALAAVETETASAAAKTENVLPSSGRVFVGTPGGKTVPIPKGWGGRAADSGKGIVYQRPGATGNADMIRIMDPTPQYPSGYVRYYNQHGQPLDVLGKPGSMATTHIPLDHQGPLPRWPL